MTTEAEREPDWKRPRPPLWLLIPMMIVCWFVAAQAIPILIQAITGIRL